MRKYQDISRFFEERGPEDIERFVDKNLDICEQVYALLRERGWTQKELAKAMGKSESEISKWLSGTHNLTLRSIAKLEAALGADIILTPQKAQKKFAERKRFQTVLPLEQSFPGGKWLGDKFSKGTIQSDSRDEGEENILAAA